MSVKFHLSRIMGEKKLKMSDVAELSGVHRNTVMALYHERAKGITWDVLEKLCMALNCQPGNLIEYIPDNQDE